MLDPATGATSHLTEPSVAALSPAWSPDGTRIAYVSAPDVGTVGGGEVARSAAAQRRIWVMNADGSGERWLTNDEGYRDERPQWSSDGTRILFARLDAEDRASLWVVPAGGGAAVKVADISRPVTPGSAPLWFGFYGYVAWGGYSDWWLPAVASAPVVPEANSASAD